MNQIEIQKLKEKIFLLDSQFSQYSKDNGVINAFQEFCSSEIIHVSRNGIITQGIEALKRKLKEFGNNNSMIWEPILVEISENGELGISKGRYKFYMKNKLNEEPIGTGNYLSIWKNHEKYGWKVIYDMDGAIFD